MSVLDRFYCSGKCSCTKYKEYLFRAFENLGKVLVLLFVKVTTTSLELRIFQYFSEQMFWLATPICWNVQEFRVGVQTSLLKCEVLLETPTTRATWHNWLSNANHVFWCQFENWVEQQLPYAIRKSLTLKRLCIIYYAILILLLNVQNKV